MRLTLTRGQRERELAYLTQTLKKLVLDRDRPFQRNPENMQKLLNLLLLMESKAKGVDQEVLAKLRFQRTLAAIASSPVVNFPVIWHISIKRSSLNMSR
jgi:hypothetical protein